MDDLRQHIIAIQKRITAAALRAGRDPADVTLVGVSKTVPPTQVRAALEAGIENLGESRVQEAAEKIAALRAEATHAIWHLIGHLQRNKVNRAVALFDVIHSLDSLELAHALSHACAIARPERPLEVLLQVNLSGESSKSGFAATNESEIAAFVAMARQVCALPHLRVSGLMTIPPANDNPEAVRPLFRCLRELRDRLRVEVSSSGWRELSMGMSDDFEVAIEEGATLARIGSALFGARS